MKSIPSCRGIGKRVTLALVLMACFALFAAETPQREPAELKISGYGFFGNRQLKKLLKTIGVAQNRPTFGANSIEDAILILMSRLNRDGYLNASITARVTKENGETERFVWNKPLEEPLPRDLHAIKVHFKIRKGPLFYYENLEFAGLESIPENRARFFFIERGALLPLKSTRVYTPERSRRSLENLLDEVNRKGFANATANLAILSSNAANGAMSVRVEVDEGKKHFVGSVRKEIFRNNATNATSVETIRPDKPYSRIWEQDFAQSLRTNYLHAGYPDTKVETEKLREIPKGEAVTLDLVARVKTGEQVEVGEVIFKGAERTHESVMRSQVKLREGDLLDRIEAEQGRYELARLGIFENVTLEYRPTDGRTRDVIYSVEEGRRININLLFGYGSYELLRAGVEIEQFNVWGLAHRQRLRLIQSIKASSGDYSYTIPDFMGRDMDIFFNGFVLLREEISFTREEYGGGVGVKKFFRAISTDVSLRYNYQILNAVDAKRGVVDEGPTNSAVGAIIADLKHDRRDNPLYPRKGYKVFTTLEVASQTLGGDVDYQRFELLASAHVPVAGSQWIHAGVSYGVALTPGDVSENLPFNKRFFPGGDNSIRGYQQGEASPRNENGRIVGAETFLLGSLEFEQALTPKFSLVVFGDSIGFARRVSDSPFDEHLFSVGGGIRWKTLIGPVRLEYGHNLNPRPRDPAGTFHLSLGFPF